MADPFVLKHQGTYYVYGTGSPRYERREADGRVFPVLRSADLVHWDWIGGALEPLLDPSLDYWAPGVAERDGTFLLYYSAGEAEGAGHRLRIAIADNPAGPFKDCGRELLPDEPFSIDAHPFRDPADGRSYLFFAKDFFDARPGTGAAVVPLKDDMVTPDGDIQTVIRPSADWQTYAFNRHWYNRDWPAWHTVEGPYVLEHERRYYCFYSGGNWNTAGYGVGYGVADHPLGPYRDDWSAKGPSVLHGTSRAIGPGHNSVALAPDGKSDVFVYHAWDVEKSARRMFIDPLVWTDTGPRCTGPTTEPQILRDY